ncbi:bifunctional homocysteine S-methyltransferase/methylenetetrahydrofolate reductase [Marinicrinis sediminis]|uniref:Bifunctional homocysteine S-methyltransferase/methylenetetrahydrofolate reductase n=1 Tax=Marinicrinis sediminis TaxID=1652465 RepID=A0ABW5R5C5_9BACL
MKSDIRTEWSRRILVGDGAMGTYLYQQGFPVGISYEELNLTKPEVIADVHRRYYQAGARVIETNTFTATREKLAKFGLENEVEEINRAGVRIAREAVGEDAFVVGAVGSIRAGKRKNMRTAAIRADFTEQIEALLAEGVDGLMLETFFDVEEMMLAMELIRERSDLPVISQFAVEEAGRTTDGYEMTRAFELVSKAGADLIGFNCRSGPNRMLRSLESLGEMEGQHFSVYPNAGIPDYVDGKFTYMATPAYFADNAVKFASLGARLIGGCCGTTPEHIEAMAKVLNKLDVNVLAQQQLEADALSAMNRESAVQPSVVPAGKTSSEAHSSVEIRQIHEPNIVELVKQRHTVIVELDPPKDLNIDTFIEGSIALQEAKVDAITMADNSLAVTRMSNSALAYLLHDKLGIRPLVHIACRDRNLIGTQSHMMGFDAMGIDHVLAVTGDPARFGDLPGSSSVYDLTSFEIIRMIKQLNEGISFSGKPLKQKAGFVVGAAFNPNVKYLDKAVKRLERKIESGADYIMTQPVYDADLIEEIYQSTKHLEVPIFLGIAPLASGGNAEYLHNEVPGIQLSDEVRERMAGLKGPEGRAMGVQIAKELLDVAVQRFNGIYLMTPFMAYQMTVDLTRYVWEITNRSDSHLYPMTK